MRFLAFCRHNNLDPFDPESKRLCRADQRHRSGASGRKARASGTERWLAELRRINNLHEAADRSRDFWLRELAKVPDSHDAKVQVARFTAERDRVQAALDQHGAEHPELAAEFALRLELRTLDGLALAARERIGAAQAVLDMPAPAPLPVYPQRLHDLRSAADEARAKAQAAQAAMQEAQRWYDAGNDLTPREERRERGEAVARARDRFARYDRAADRASAALSRALETQERRAQVDALAEQARRDAQALLPAYRTQLEEITERMLTIEAHLPNPPRAPLVRQYRRRDVPTRTRRPNVHGDLC